MASPAQPDYLRRSGFADIPLFFVHALQAHDTGIAAVTGDAAESLGGVDIRFVLFRWFGQMLDAQSEMANSAVILLWLGHRTGGRQ
jgi:hypothetical protein